MAEKGAAKKNVFLRIRDFFKGLKAEVKKIAWPNAKTTFRQTVVVIIISAVMCGFIRLIDIAATLVVGALSQIF